LSREEVVVQHLAQDKEVKQQQMVVVLTLDTMVTGLLLQAVEVVEGGFTLLAAMTIIIPLLQVLEGKVFCKVVQEE